MVVLRNVVSVPCGHKKRAYPTQLKISKQIIELHHGAIGFESCPDALTTFYFTLPLKKN